MRGCTGRGANFIFPPSLSQCWAWRLRLGAYTRLVPCAFGEDVRRRECGAFGHAVQSVVSRLCASCPRALVAAAAARSCTARQPLRLAWLAGLAQSMSRPGARVSPSSGVAPACLRPLRLVPAAPERS